MITVILGAIFQLMIPGLLGKAVDQAIRVFESSNTEVEKLDLSSRTLNCLKRASIDKVGQVLELKRPDLLEIRNFGEKSLNELYVKLRELELMPAELDPDLAGDTSDGTTGTEDADETES